jgi:cytoskeleton protein RodZ
MARAERGMTLEDVAARSCISMRSLVALEADDYARLPDAVYVRGYLRRYAALLGIVAQPLIDDFDAQYGAYRDDNGSTARRGQRQLCGPRRIWFLGVGAAVVLILGALLLAVFG